MPRETLLIADLHLHQHPRWRLDWCREFVDWVLQEHAKPGRNLCLMGDVFESRDHLDSRVSNLFLELVFKWQQVAGEVSWIAGQHDSYLPGKATLQALKHSNVLVVDDQVHHSPHIGATLVPYARDKGVYRGYLKSINSGEVLLTHLPVKEALEGIGAPGGDEISVTEFSRFSFVLSGDIHNPHVLKDPIVHYVGAPSQRDFRDKHVVGRIGLLTVRDVENWQRDQFATVTWIPTTHPIHVDLTAGQSLPQDSNTKLVVKLPRGAPVPENAIATVESVTPPTESIPNLSPAVTGRGALVQYAQGNPFMEFSLDDLVGAGEVFLQAAEEEV